MAEYKQEPTELCDNTSKKYEYAEVDDLGKYQAYKRSDGDWDVPIDLTNDEWLALSLEAHRQNITLNQLMINIIKEKLDLHNA